MVFLLACDLRVKDRYGKEELKMASRCLWVLMVAVGLSSMSAAALVDFEDLPLESESYWNGSDLSGGFSSGGAYFNNNYNSQYGSWDGFAYSNITNATASGFGAQYNAVAGSGQGGSANYAIGYVGWAEPPTMTLNTPMVVEGLYVTNNNFAYYSMLRGDAPPARQFGGEAGDEPDWFLLTITGRDGENESLGSVDFYLADFRFADSGEDYIVDAWQYVDTSSLGVVQSLEFALSSSDVGDWGMNTPAYFAVDTAIPEPATFVLLCVGALATVRRRSRG